MKSCADCDGSHSGADKIKMESVDVFTYEVTLLVGGFYLQMVIGLLVNITGIPWYCSGYGFQDDCRGSMHTGNWQMFVDYWCVAKTSAMVLTGDMANRIENY